MTAASNPVRGFTAIWLATALSALAACGDERAKPTANVLLITLDTTRADSLGCYGGPAGVTPNIDALGLSGAVFDLAVTPVPLTLPAHATLLTGLDPYEHGVRNNSTYRLDDEHVTLAEQLSAEGYETAAFVGAYVLAEPFGLAQGFGEFDDDIAREGSEFVSYPERPAGPVTDAALAWLERRSESPFFAWVHYYDPHFPHAAPAGWAGKFASPYHDEVAYCDGEIGRLVESLERRGLMEDTLVIVTADHGEGMGDHAESTHGYFVYQGTQHVPLVLSHPSLKGRGRVPDLARLKDVPWTVMRFLGVDAPNPSDARDLLADLGGDTPPLAYMETELPRVDFGLAPQRAAIDGRTKLIHGPSPELYDLDADPRELSNLASSRPEVVERLARWLDRLPTAGAGGGTFDAGSEARERIAHLGYASGLDEAEVSVGDWTQAELAEWADLRSKGTLLALDGQVEEAILVLEELVRLAPQSYAGHLHLGLAYLRQENQHEQALEHLLRAAEIQPRLPADNYWNIAVCHKVLGQDELAFGALSRAIESDPGHVNARQKLAVHFLEAGDRAGARPHLEALIEYGQGTPQAEWAERQLEQGGR